MRRTLLLNASYEPLMVISVNRAVSLVLVDKAEVVEESEEALIRSASYEMFAPSVIRLKYYVKVPYKARVPLSRRAVLTRDNHSCQYCGKAGADTLDHVHPRSRGGAHTWENLVACCRKCNHTKGDKTLDQLGWKLARKPIAPTGDYWLVLSGGSVEAWKPYLPAISG